MDLYDNPFSPYTFSVNPRGEVPALVDDGAAICHSKVICAYSNEVVRAIRRRICRNPRKPSYSPCVIS